MRTVVFGKKIENWYRVDSKQQDIRRNDDMHELVFTGRPELLKESNYAAWTIYTGDLYITETEIVHAQEEIFRADLNEVHVRTDKVMSDIDWYKEESEKDYAELIKIFNKQMIESNDKMKSYCDLHKLNYEETDCIELFKMVYPDDSWEIKDGKMQMVSKMTITGSLDGGTIWGVVPSTTIDKITYK